MKDIINIENLIKNEFNPCKPDKYIPIFEEKLKDFFSVKNAIAVANGTSAIHLSLAVLNIKEGDEVLVPANAVIMSVIPILYQRAIPIFVDCQENNIDFDYDDLRRKASNKTKAVIPVYLWGCSYNLDKLLDFAKEYNIEIIEDACQAHGSKWNNKYLGTFGKFGCFSMKNGKILATGEGGFILTDDDELAERCRLLRNHCTNIRETSKSFSEMGWNYRITEMQALLGIYNLRDLKDKINFRRNQTKYIYEQIKNITGVNIYNYYDNENSNYFSPIFLHDKGLDIAKKLNKNRVINSTGTFGLIPANERKVIQEYCKNLVSYDRMKTPNSHKLFSKIVALSLMKNMDRDKMNEIISKINQIMLYTYNKLIRDKNVKIMEDKGCKVTYEILDDKRYGEELDKKLKEEVEEYLDDYSVEEMADIMEVIYAILEYRGTNMEEVEKVRIKKRNRKGAFKNKVFLKNVEED